METWFVASPTLKNNFYPLNSLDYNPKNDYNHFHCCPCHHKVTKDLMMTVLGKNNHPLPSNGVITHTIPQSPSSCRKKNMILLSTTANGSLSWIGCTCVASDTSL
jgi:hypothetical protein